MRKIYSLCTILHEIDTISELKNCFIVQFNLFIRHVTKKLRDKILSH